MNALVPAGSDVVGAAWMGHGVELVLDLTRCKTGARPVD